MRKEGFVYKWKHKESGKMYIGSHYGNIDDGYVSSSNEFNPIYDSDPLMFERTIIVRGLTRKQALKEEKELLISVDAANSEEYYNLHNEPGNGWSHHDNPKLSKKYYAKISKARKGQLSPHKGKKVVGRTQFA